MNAYLDEPLGSVDAAAPMALPKRRRLRKPHLPRRAPKDERQRERLLIIDQPKEGEPEPFIPYWFASLPKTELKRLPYEARYLPANRNFVYLTMAAGAGLGYTTAVGILLAMWGIPVVAFTLGFVPGVVLGLAVGALLGHLLKPRPLWILKRHRADRDVATFEAYEPAAMLQGMTNTLFVVRGSFMANVVKQIGVLRMFSVGHAKAKQMQFVALLVAGGAMAVIILFTLVLSSDPKLTGGESPVTQAAPAVAVEAKAK